MNVSRILAVVFTLLIIGCSFYFFSDIVAYVLISWVLSMIGQPLMRFFQKLHIGKKIKIGPTIAAVLTLICFVIFFTVIIGMFVPLVIQQAQNLATVDYNQIGQSLADPISRVNNWLTEKGLMQPGQSITQEVQDNIKHTFNPARIGTFMSSLVGFASSFVIGIFSIFFITFFFLKEQGLFIRMISAIVPSGYDNNVEHAIEDVSKLLTRYFGGIMVQISINTIFVTLFLMVLGVKNALLIGFFAAIINVIPYIGPMIGAAFGIFITISSNLDLEFYTQMLPLMGKVVLVFGCMQMLDNFFVQPYIFSNSVLAHPLEIFIIVLVGAKLGGISGMVLAIPAYTVLRVIARGFFHEYKIVQRLTDSMGGKMT